MFPKLAPVLDLYTFAIPVFIVSSSAAHFLANKQVSPAATMAFVESVILFIVLLGANLVTKTTVSSLKHRVHLCLAVVASLMCISSVLWIANYLASFVLFGSAVQYHVCSTVTVGVLVTLLARKCPHRWTEFIASWITKVVVLHRLHVEGGQGSGGFFDFSGKIRMIHELCVQITLLQDAASLLLKNGASEVSFEKKKK